MKTMGRPSEVTGLENDPNFKKLAQDYDICITKRERRGGTCHDCPMETACLTLWNMVSARFAIKRMTNEELKQYKELFRRIKWKPKIQ